VGRGGQGGGGWSPIYNGNCWIHRVGWLLFVLPSVLMSASSRGNQRLWRRKLPSTRGHHSCKGLWGWSSNPRTAKIKKDFEVLSSTRDNNVLRVLSSTRGKRVLWGAPINKGQPGVVGASITQRYPSVWSAPTKKGQPSACYLCSHKPEVLKCLGCSHQTRSTKCCRCSHHPEVLRCLGCMLTPNKGNQVLEVLPSTRDNRVL
jgi:hypothetical protein